MKKITWHLIQNMPQQSDEYIVKFERNKSYWHEIGGYTVGDKKFDFTRLGDDVIYGEAISWAKIPV